MHNCALRLLPSQHTSFTTLLQVAAARAWVRTATNTVLTEQKTTKDPSTSLRSVLYRHCRARLIVMCNGSSRSNLPSLSQNTTAVTKSPSISARWEQRSENSASFDQHRNATACRPVSFHPARRPGLRRRPSVTYFPVENVDDSDFQCVDPGRSYTCGFRHPSQIVHAVRSRREKDTSIVGVLIGKLPLQTPPIPLVPVAITPASLYRNILYILSYRPVLPSLAALLDYHDLHPSLRSTRSYNLLIWFALRHSCFGTVPWLLSAMRADGLTANLETWKLKVRWLVQTGSWDRAWNEVVHSNPAFKMTSSTGTAIPLPLWLEFFRAVKRGALSGSMKKRQDGNNNSLLDSDSNSVLSARYRILMANPPSLAFHDLAHTPPRTVYFVVLTMLNTRHNTTALSLTKSYFHSLSSRISAAWIRTCLDIIHLHIVMGSAHKGLKKFYEARRAMNTLLNLHPALRPTSTTLFLLFAPLRQAKRCGTIAWNILRRSKSQWGTRMEDRRVRRRVAALAAKEGRMDIVNAILLTERKWSRMHGDWKTAEQVLGRMSMAPPRRRLLRPPAKKLFKHNGREERQWHLLKRRIERVIQNRGKTIVDNVL
jgi:hypothetical protein